MFQAHVSPTSGMVELTLRAYCGSLYRREHTVWNYMHCELEVV